MNTAGKALNKAGKDWLTAMADEQKKSFNRHQQNMPETVCKYGSRRFVLFTIHPV
jgi:hypothetical protein